MAARIIDVGGGLEKTPREPSGMSPPYRPRSDELTLSSADAAPALCHDHGEEVSADITAERGATVGFLANRNVLVAATFGVSALIAPDCEIGWAR